MLRDKRRYAALTLLTAIIVAAMAATAAAQDSTWLAIDKFSAVGGNDADSDSFTMSGSFALPPDSVDPRSDVTLTIDEWSVTFPAASWQQVGTKPRFKAQSNGVTADVSYWVSGGSRCTFKFSGKNQALQASTPNFPEIPVTLTVDAAFSETVIAMMEEKGRKVFMLDQGPTPTLLLDRLMVTLNTKKANADKALLGGRIFLSDDNTFDFVTDSITGNIGPVAFAVPPGALALKGSKASYAAPLVGGGTFKFTVSAVTGQFTITLAKTDLSAITNPVDVGLNLVGVDGASWLFQPTLGVDKSGRKLTY